MFNHQTLHAESEQYSTTTYFYKRNSEIRQLMTVLQVLAADLESGDTVKAALHVEVLQKGQPGTRKYSSSLDYILIRNIQIYKIKIVLHT